MCLHVLLGYAPADHRGEVGDDDHFHRGGRTEHHSLGDEEILKDCQEERHQPGTLNLLGKGHAQQKTEVEADSVEHSRKAVGHVLEAMVDELFPLFFLLVHRLGYGRN